MAKTRKAPRPAPPPRALASPARPWLPAAIIVAAAALAYSNSFRGPLIFDDVDSIQLNPVIKAFPPAWRDLMAQRDITVAGRPVLSYSLALNYALHGLAPWGYHLTNLCIHVAAALALLGALRRTLESAACPQRVRDGATGVAFASALLWAVHPIQTGSVTYIVQRAESMMGMLVLVAFYCAIRARATISRAASGWNALAVASCVLAIGTKEAAAMAPPLILLHDRMFSSGTFARALRARPGLYAAMALPYVVLVAVALGARSETAGFAAGFHYGITPWKYLSIQAVAIPRYLGLCLWPSLLSIDYYFPLTLKWSIIAPLGILLALLVIATMAGVARNRPIAYAGAWFFGILAPSSSIMAVPTELVAEHRMYLPLASLTTLAALCATYAIGRASLGAVRQARLQRAALATVAALLMAATFRRNLDYRSTEAIWESARQVIPYNPRALKSLAAVYIEQGRKAEAEQMLKQAMRVTPTDPNLIQELSVTSLELGKIAEAEAFLRQVTIDQPGFAGGFSNYGVALYKLGRRAEAEQAMRKALALNPTLMHAHYNLAMLLVDERPRWDEAEAHLREAIKADPASPDPLGELAFLLARQNRMAEAVPLYRDYLLREPGDAVAHYRFALCLLQQGARPEAEGHLREALRIAPGYAEPKQLIERLSQQGH